MSRFTRPILLLSPLPFAGALMYTFASKKLASEYPEIPVERLPERSFTRRIVEESRRGGLRAFGESRGEGKEGEGEGRLWAAYYDVHQAIIPRSDLEAYITRNNLSPTLSPTPAAPARIRLNAGFVHAFITSGLMSLERKLTSSPPLDSLSIAGAGGTAAKGQFEPGMELVRGVMRVWDSADASLRRGGLPSLNPRGAEPRLAKWASSLPSDQRPPSALPPYSADFFLSGGGGSAGGEGSPTHGGGRKYEYGWANTVLYWRMPDRVVGFFDSLADWGYPWRLMKGGWHELLVEHVDVSPPGGEAATEAPGGDIPKDEKPGEEVKGEEMVKLTFTSVHIYDTLGRGDRRVIPQWVRGMHRTFGRAVLRSTVKRIRSGS